MALEVLVVDDEADIRDLVSGVLEDEGYAVRAAADSTAALEAIEERQGLKVACLEEIAWQNGWIGEADVRAAAESMGKSTYAAYLHGLLKSDRRP